MKYLLDLPEKIFTIVEMAGLEGFPSVSGGGQYWNDQKFVEGDPRRPVNINLSKDQNLGKKKLSDNIGDDLGDKEGLSTIAQALCHRAVNASAGMSMLAQGCQR